MNNALNTYIQNQILVMPTKFNEELTYANEKLHHRLDYAKIIEYINDFLDGKNINRYLVLPGIRGVGKSTILMQVYEYLTKEKQINPKNILYMSCDNLRKMANSDISDAVGCYLKIYHNSIIETQKEPVFLLIDEAQYDADWSLTGKIIFDSTKNIFMIFTGSSALELTYNADSARRLLKIPIPPLNYPEHLKLKYGQFNNDISQSIINLIFDGEIDEKIESKILDTYSGFGNYDVNEWEEYLKYGGFPSPYRQKTTEISKKIIDSIDRVITTDMEHIQNINGQTGILAYQLLYFLALQNPGEISKGSIANNLDSNKPTIHKLLNILEKTQLIFHVEPFTSSAKRTTKPNKYYFATSSLKHILSQNLGNANLEEKNAYMGKLFENFVASSFFNLDIRSDIQYKIYYDGRRKQHQNVDFLVQRGLEHPIPIEVSMGDKDKSQIKGAISKYKSEYGVIISNTTTNIVKKDNIIYLPPKIFAFM